MRNQLLAVALCAPLMATGSVMFSPSNADESACGVAPAEAVMTLPRPLNKWAQIVCTKSGQVITGHDGWVWIEPTRHAVVIIPSQSLKSQLQENKVDMDPADAVGQSYFTKIELTKVKGDEFDKVYEVFHSGFDAKDGKPTAYRLDLTTMAGKEIRLYMFDYFTYGWGMACSAEACDPASRFVMLNMSEDPKALPPAI